MKIHRSILISSVVVLASRIYEISCGTPAALSKNEESSVPTNLPTVQVSGENVVSARSVSSTEKSANETEKRQEKLNIKEEKRQTPKNVTTRKNETQEKSRGLFNDIKNLKPKRNSENLMNSLSSEASTSGGTLLSDIKNDESSSKEEPSRQTPKPIETGVASEKARKGDGQKKATNVPALRSMFEDLPPPQNNEGSGNFENKAKVVMEKIKSLPAKRRETLIPYFDRFLTKILKKLESRDDAELDDVEDLMDRCLTARCCNNCCSCQRRRRRKMKPVSHMVHGVRRKAKSDDDVSDEKTTKKLRDLGTIISGVTSASTTSLKTTRITTTTTTTTPKPDTTMIVTTKTVNPNKEVQVERLKKLRKRPRKRPLVARRKMEEIALGRKQKCIRQRPISEPQQQQQQQRQNDNERTSRPSHRSNFDQEADDSETLTPIKNRINDESSDSFEENDS